MAARSRAYRLAHLAVIAVWVAAAAATGTAQQWNLEIAREARAMLRPGAELAVGVLQDGVLRPVANTEMTVARRPFDLVVCAIEHGLNSEIETITPMDRYGVESSGRAGQEVTSLNACRPEFGTVVLNGDTDAISRSVGLGGGAGVLD